MGLQDVLTKVVELGGSDVFIVPGAPVTYKVRGQVVAVPGDRLTPTDTEQLLRQAYAIAPRLFDRLALKGDDDFSFSVSDVGRFRCSAYRQRGSLAASLRLVMFGLPDPKQMHVPDAVVDLYRQNNGLVLVTGAAGSGKTTTLACIVDRINSERAGHIITIEDPIEYLHPHKGCVISQREVGADTESFSVALRAALRQAPDVIMVGEMRDYETAQTAITAAETGHLVLSSLHTVGAAKTIDRIVDSFPANQQAQVRVQLSLVLRAVVSQHLIPTIDGGLYPAFEVMMVTPAIQSMIREGKTHQIDNVIYGGAAQGMVALDADLLRLYKEGIIGDQHALLYAANPDLMQKKL